MCSPHPAALVYSNKEEQFDCDDDCKVRTALACIFEDEEVPEEEQGCLESHSCEVRFCDDDSGKNLSPITLLLQLLFS